MARWQGRQFTVVLYISTTSLPEQTQALTNRMILQLGISTT